MSFIFPSWNSEALPMGNFRRHRPIGERPLKPDQFGAPFWRMLYKPLGEIAVPPARVAPEASSVVSSMGPTFDSEATNSATFSSERLVTFGGKSASVTSKPTSIGVELRLEL